MAAIEMMSDRKSELELADRFLRMLNANRFLQEEFWLAVGKALFTIDQGGENGLQTWIHHTERVLIETDRLDKPFPGFMELPCSLESLESLPALGRLNHLIEVARQHYATFEGNLLTLKTLAWYAKEDNPEEYAEWHLEWCLEGVPADVSNLTLATMVYRTYWLEFLYNPEAGRWFQFEACRWAETPTGMGLRKRLTRDFTSRLENYASACVEAATVQKICALVSHLKIVAIRSGVMAEAKTLFQHPDMGGVLDTNPYLLRAPNGTLEIVQDRIVLRSTKPEDFVSRTLGTPYSPDFTWNHPRVRECIQWIGQLFPLQTGQRHHFLKLMASCLRHGNSEKMLPILLGPREQVESLLSLIESTFGSYYTNTSILEKNLSSVGPSIAGVRAFDGALLKRTWIKIITGDSIEGSPKTLVIGDAEAPPLIPYADIAVRNRVKFFLLQSGSEVTSASISAEAFLWILVQYYPFYSMEGMSEPECIRVFTEQFWKQNDFYAQFETEWNLEFAEEEGAPIREAPWTQIYTEFKRWHRQQFTTLDVPEKQVVKKALMCLWYSTV